MLPADVIWKKSLIGKNCRHNPFNCTLSTMKRNPLPENGPNRMVEFKAAVALEITYLVDISNEFSRLCNWANEQGLDDQSEELENAVDDIELMISNLKEITNEQ